VACHLAPGADLEGTYKPCFRTRVITEVAPGILDLLDTNDKVLASREVDTGTTYVQLPLYSQPNVPFAPGAYRLRLRLRDAQGESSLGLHIE
jgi:hypothetical protein